MTRIFTDGAEMGDTLFWSSGAVYVAATSPTPRSGEYRYQVGGARKYFTALSELYFRQGLYPGQMHNATVIHFSTSTLENAASVRFTNDYIGKIELLINGGLVATSTTAYAYNTWHLMEIYLKIANSNGIFSVKMNGVISASYVGDTQTSYSYVDNFNYYVNDSAWYVDDLALNDTNGTVDNSWCGDGRIIKLTASGSGTVNQFSNSGSVSGSANYLYVDDFPSDGDTTYVYASSSSIGAIDNYALSNYSGITSINIKGIYSECRAKMTTSGSNKIKLGYLPDGGTNTLSGSVALSMNYERIVGDYSTANPVSGSAWTIADIDALQYTIEEA